MTLPGWDPAVECRNSFMEYTGIDAAREWRDSYPHLGDAAWAWLAFGNGARACGNNYALFLSAFLVAIEAWQQHPDTFVHREDHEAGIRTPPTELLDIVSCSHCQQILNPLFFQMMVADPDRIKRQVAQLRADQGLPPGGLIYLDELPDS